MTGGTEYLRAADIVRLTGVSIRTVRRWIADQILPSSKVRGARIVAMADFKAVLSAPQDSIQDAQEEYNDESEL